MMTSAQTAADRARSVLATVMDPEVPVLSVCDLGIVREVTGDASGLSVVVTPTYSGCPATEVISESIRAALASAGFDQVSIEMRFSPAWTTDWISEEALAKLKDYGIAPPMRLDAAEAQPLRFQPRNVCCPRCSSSQTERLSAFGSTACKSLYRCKSCREPFEHFKPI